LLILVGKTLGGLVNDPAIQAINLSKLSGIDKSGMLLITHAYLNKELLRQRHRPLVRRLGQEQYADYKVRSFQQEICARQPWFDPSSPYDLKVTTYSEPQDPIEVDTIENLRLSQSNLYAPRNQFIVYQQWGERLPEGGRPYLALTVPAAVAVAEILRGGSTRNLILLCTTFMPGAIRAFVDTLIQNEAPDSAPQLEFLGFFWYFSGDDITDEPEHSADVAYAANRLRLKRLTVLTGAFNSECEDLLVAGLQQNTTLEYFGVFHKTEQYTWEQIPTPQVDALVSANRSQ
jgi:hypothetical protein